MVKLAPIACSQALGLLMSEEPNLRRFAVALGTMYGMEPSQWPEAISYISKFTVLEGEHSFDTPTEASRVYETILPHRGSLKLVHTYQHLHPDPNAPSGDFPLHFIMGQLCFPAERLSEEHFGVVPANYMTEGLAQLLAVAAATKGQIKEGYVPLLGKNLGDPLKPLPTKSETPVWAIIAYAHDKELKRFAACGLIGQETNLNYAGAVLGVSYPRCRLK